MQFTKEYKLPSEIEMEEKIEKASKALSKFHESQRPNRIYKKPKHTKKLDIKQQVASVSKSIFYICCFYWYDKTNSQKISCLVYLFAD